jgi:hypothetical protein
MEMAYVRGFTQDCRQKGIFVWPTECLEADSAIRGVEFCSEPVPCLPFLTQYLTVDHPQCTGRRPTGLGLTWLDEGCRLPPGYKCVREKGDRCSEQKCIQGQENLLDNGKVLSPT